MKKVLLTLAMLATTVGLMAQTKYHDVEANDAKGPVKSIVETVMGQESTTNFTPEGQMQKAEITDMVYDENGYLKSAKVEIQGMKMDVKYTWKNGRVAGNSMDMMGQEMSTTITYNEQGVPTSTTISVAGQLMVSTYTDYQFDDHGNWISRKTA